MIPTPTERTRIQIRAAESDDIPALLDLLNANHDQVLARTADDIRATLPLWRVAVAADGRVIGCSALMRLNTEVGEIRSLVVAREYRAAGLARSWWRR